LPCGFFYLSSFFISSPNLSRRRLDVYHTSTHDVALVRISDAAPIFGTAAITLGIGPHSSFHWFGLSALNNLERWW